jgi:hypothetical protein
MRDLKNKINLQTKKAEILLKFSNKLLRDFITQKFENLNSRKGKTITALSLSEDTKIRIWKISGLIVS